MNTIFTKLKTSATLWSVVGGFVLGLANIVWGADSTASSISSAILFAVPAASYIVSKFALRIKMADINADGQISLQELATALSVAASETTDETKEVIEIIGNVMDTLSKKEALIDQGKTVPDKEGE